MFIVIVKEEIRNVLRQLLSGPSLLRGNTFSLNVEESMSFILNEIEGRGRESERKHIRRGI